MTNGYCSESLAKKVFGDFRTKSLRAYSDTVTFE